MGSCTKVFFLSAVSSAIAYLCFLSLMFLAPSDLIGSGTPLRDVCFGVGMLRVAAPRCAVCSPLSYASCVSIVAYARSSMR
jgi:hypothetical protein